MCGERLRAWAWAALFLGACAGDGGWVRDADRADAARLDAAGPDGPLRDVGRPGDAVPSGDGARPEDAASARDARPAEDGGLADLGRPLDAADGARPGDVGPPADAEAIADARLLDGGGGPADATSRDAAPPDAAPDAAVPPDAAPPDGCDPRLPPGWPARWTPDPHNPLLVPSHDAALQGADNAYAPDLHAHAGGWLLWYGAQGGDGHDRIFLATSRDGRAWRKWPSGDDPQPVLDRGPANHINDPSVVRVDGRWRMYYTVAPRAEEDVIALALADSPNAFIQEGFVLRPGPDGAWDSVKVGRPAVLYEDGLYRMWYDGTGPGGRRHVGLATSDDGVRFVRHPQNPVLLDAGAVDVQRVGDVYVLLHEGHDGTRWATSRDGVCWLDRGRLFGLSGAAYDAHGQVTPFLWLVDGAPRGVWFGGASAPAWNRNRIAVALPGGVGPEGGGCSACLPPGRVCAEACQGEGVCAAPGSADPGRCCACAPEPCAGCLGIHDDCGVACVAGDHAGGWCAHPGSVDPGRCCACLE